jgi:hypothetical protein
MERLIDLKSIKNIVSLMGGTIRFLPYLRVPDLAYKLIACAHHRYGNIVIGIGVMPCILRY